MADKSLFGLSLPNIFVLLGVLALGAAIYFVSFTDRDAPDAVVQSAPETGSDQPAAEPSTNAEDEEDEVDTAAVAPSEGTTEIADEATASNTGGTEQSQSNDAETPVAETPTDQTDGSADGEETDPPAVAQDTPEEIAPSFDVVRIDPEGSAVIAGRAEAGTAVRLLADGEVVAETVADGTGKFVALFDLPPSDAPRSLSAEAEGSGGVVVASGGTVLIAPTKPVEVAEVTPTPSDDAVQPEAVAEAEPEDVPGDDVIALDTTEPQPAPQIVEQLAPEVAPETPAIAEPEIDTTVETAEAPIEQPQEVESAAAPAQEAPATEQPATVEVAEVEPTAPAIPDSPAIVLADETGVTVLQPAPRPAVPAQDSSADERPRVVSNLVIDTITYDQQGEVALGGRGAADSFARIYVNDQPIQTVQIQEDGSWASPLPDIDAGVYRLRIDEVTADGEVTSRVETPFQREAPAVAAEAIQRPNAVTVQEGFTLWAIAKDRFGSGFEYVRVYEANRDLIRDPDLIYPGQVFELPEG